MERIEVKMNKMKELIKIYDKHKDYEYFDIEDILDQLSDTISEAKYRLNATRLEIKDIKEVFSKAFALSEHNVLSNRQVREHVLDHSIKIKLKDIKQILDEIFGEEIKVNFRTSSLRGIKGLALVPKQINTITSNNVVLP